MEGNEWNVISEWGLVCDREFVGALISSTYFCGVMVGGIIFGYFSDKFGRKNIMLICLYTQCVIGIALHFVRRLVVFMGLRCIQGIFIQGLQCVTYSMVMELFSRKYRAMAGCIIEAFLGLRRHPPSLDRPLRSALALHSIGHQHSHLGHHLLHLDRP